jgi:sugar phosphate isomerase/epimerase
LRGWAPSLIGDVVAAAGFDAVEWAVGPGQVLDTPERAVRELPPLMARHELDAVCVTVQGGAASLLDPLGLRPFLELAELLGAPYVRVFPPDFQRGSLADATARARSGLEEAVELARPHGVAILIEVCPGTVAPSTAQARALVGGCPAERAGVLYDPGNMVIEGHVSPRVAIAELGDRLRHVHVKNVAWRRQADGWRWRHAQLTRGLLDWGEILAELDRAGYPGLLALDHIAGRPTLAGVNRDAEILRRAVP